MPKKSPPAFPELLVHHSVNIMKVNCLERFQELVGSMEKARPLFDRERTDIFQPIRQMRSTSAFSMKGLVTSRRAVAAASCVASLATRVLRWTCTARYNTDKTTAIDPTNCEMALIASQFISVLYHR